MKRVVMVAVLALAGCTAQDQKTERLAFDGVWAWSEASKVISPSCKKRFELKPKLDALDPGCTTGNQADCAVQAGLRRELNEAAAACSEERKKSTADFDKARKAYLDACGRCGKAEACEQRLHQLLQAKARGADLAFACQK